MLKNLGFCWLRKAIIAGRSDRSKAWRIVVEAARELMPQMSRWEGTCWIELSRCSETVVREVAWLFAFEFECWNGETLIKQRNNTEARFVSIM